MKLVHPRWMRAVLGLLVVMVTITATVGLAPVPAEAARGSTPQIEFVEIRPDKSLLVAWSPVSGRSSYDIVYREAGGSWSTVRTAAVSADETTVRRVLRPGQGWPAQYDVDYEIAIQAGSATSVPAPVRLVDDRFEIEATRSTTTTVSADWPKPVVGEPFVRYDVYLARFLEHLQLCKYAEIDDINTSTLTMDRQVEECRNSPIDAGMPLTVGVRKVQHAEPLVMTRLATSRVQAQGGVDLEPHLQTAEIDGEWKIVDQNGDPFIINGINMRRGEPSQLAYNVGEFKEMRTEGFNAVRIALDWSRFQIGYQEYDWVSFDALDRSIAYAGAADVPVILDILHVHDSPTWGLPQWAWDHSNDGQVDPEMILDVIAENAHEFVADVAQRWQHHDAIVAIDIINEPREPSGSSPDRQGELITLYHDLIETIRDVDTEIPLILEPFYGSALMPGAKLAEVRNPTVADPAPVAADYENLVWSIHDYYTGSEGRATDDGFSDSGFPLRGLSEDGNRLRTESWVASGCYPSGNSASDCTDRLSRVGVTIPSMRRHLQRHIVAAETADMAFFVGEYGIPHSGGGYQGWGGGPEFLSDKVRVYDDLGVGRALWAWRLDVDPTFGVYDRATTDWHDWTRYASGREVADLPPLRGEVSCDHSRNIIDALMIAQYAVGNRRSAECPLTDLAIQIDSSSADITGDGVVNVIDALLVSQCAAGSLHERC